MKSLFVILSLLMAFSSYARLTNADLQQLGNVSLGKNMGFERGTSGWDNTGGAYDTTTAAGSVGIGNVSATFESTAADQYLTSDVISLDKSKVNKLCAIRVFAMGDSDSYQLQMLDSDNADDIIASSSLPAYADSFKETAIAYGKCPANIKIRVASIDDGDTIYLDGFKLDFNTNDILSLNDGEIGEIKAIARDHSNPPENFLYCDGSSLLRSEYPDLFEVIGTAYGAADSTHFNLPDLRGKFIRGADNGAGNDPDAASRIACILGGNVGDMFGSCQSDAFQGHSHGSTYSVSTGGAVNAFYRGNQGDGSTQTLLTNIIEKTPYGLPRYGDETRPKNVAVNHFIRYNKSTNVQIIDGDKTSFFYRGYITGGSLQGLSGNTSYFVSTAANMQLTSINGDAMIACNGELATGNTCATQDETLGITIDLPSTGKYKVCYNGRIRYDGSYYQPWYADSWAIGTTSNTSPTTSVSIASDSFSGSDNGTYEGGGSQTVYGGFNGCGTIIVSKGLNTIRVFNRLVGSSGGTRYIHLGNEADDFRLNITVERVGYDMTALGIATSNMANIGDVKSSLLTEAQFQHLHGVSWVLCDGRDVSGSRYASLTGSTVVPNMLGRTLRGLDAAGTVDPDGAGRSLGDTQEDAFQGHEHEFQRSTGSYGYTGDQYVSPARSYPNFTTSNILEKSGYGAPRYEDETRMKNVAVNFFCKIN
jgi:microcystin-dependent protein